MAKRQLATNADEERLEQLRRPITLSAADSRLRRDLVQCEHTPDEREALLDSGVRNTLEDTSDAVAKIKPANEGDDKNTTDI
jgi:hypothetical protein